MKSRKEGKEESAIPMIILMIIIGAGAILLVGYLLFLD
jgi:hypothetical protein